MTNPAESRPGAAGRPELIVIAKPEAGLRVEATGVASTVDADVVALSSTLASAGASMRPLFGATEAEARAAAEATPAADDGSEMADLGLFYRVDAEEDRLEELAAQLYADDLVEAAYVKPAAELPTVAPEAPGGADQTSLMLNSMLPTTEEPPQATPDFVANQGYLNAAPVGVDARYAWTRAGGRGAGARVVDCEWAWRFNHEDLRVNQGGVIAGTNGTDQGSMDHGTAVIGEISGDVNTFGITGIASDSWIAASSFTDQSSAQAIRAAADRLGPGDIILLEIHRAGPNSPNPLNGQRGFIAVEWWPDDFAAIQYAVRRGIIVVEAAGNGFENLDAAIYDTRPAGFPSTWRNPFNAANPNPGAVMVGAGAPPPNQFGGDWGTDRSRLDFSNWGARVDAQGWGRGVTTTGYGDRQGGSSQDRWYTATFSGTSSASPIVVGALASVQGVFRGRGPLRLSPDRARRLLRQTGSPQQDTTGRPRTQRIGNRPDLRHLISAATRLSVRYGDVDGDGRAELMVTSPWGMGLLKLSGSSVSPMMMHPNGTRFGGWLLNTEDNQLCPLADYDGDGRAEILATSPWGIGVLKSAGSTLSAPMMAPNGTRFGGWLLNTGDNYFGPVGNFGGGSTAEIVVSSPWGLGILRQSGSSMTAPMLAPNGTRFGGWLLNTSDNHFGPVGDFDGDGVAEFLVQSPWGLGIMKRSGSTMSVPMMAPNGTRFGGWLLNTADNHFGPVGDFDGDGRAEVLVTSPWGIGILKLSGGTLSAPMMQPNGTRFGGWLLNTGDNRLGSVANYDGNQQAETLITSPWGLGFLRQSGNTMTAPMMAPNGTRFGGWLLNTADNEFGN
ncbi:MAG TPA: S8 family serine peptidase [Actinophytocola sp.]|nr:S8 family serine peptidase [Actinophytocola sp.]